MVICGEEPLEVGKRYVRYIIDRGGVEHEMPFVVLRPATVDDLEAQHKELNAVPRRKPWSKYIYVVSID